jgi:ABC-type Zn uptake system ZnuABC Zn-binding protein ZnuA
MRNTLYILLILFQFSFSAEKINVVTTLSTYANIAQYIGKEKINVSYIVPGDQDPHFVRPKPSYAVLLNKADIFVSTGLDLELWAPTLVDMSKNNNIRSGQPGYVAAYAGIELLDKPSVLSRSEGGLHIYGNPHITTSPLNFKVIAENITIGLEKKDPKNSEFYRRNLKEFQAKIDSAVFGTNLIKLMGSKLLTKLANQGQLIDFLNKKSYKGKKLITYLGGWLKSGLNFRGKKLVGYHKNWIYFQRLFGVKFIDYVEPKPGIPPSPKHIEELIREMRKNNVKVLFSANYFSEQKVNEICDKVGAKPIMVPMGVDSKSGVKNVFELTDLWVMSLKKAFQNN